MEAELTRTVRFTLRPDGSLDESAAVDNSHAAWPPLAGLGRYYELHVTCRGSVDDQTGYLLNIKHIDAATRSRVLPRVARCAEVGGRNVGQLLRDAWTELSDELSPAVHRVGLQLTPTVCYTIEGHDMSRVLISQRYEFSAAHRLHAPALSAEENRRMFGKCNNPSGHGHNYRLEVTVAAPIDDQGATAGVGVIDAIVDQHVVERFDHQHLNIDTDDFADANPSAENIARRCYDLLQPPLADAGLELDHVKVWETEKTVCTYHGE